MYYLVDISFLNEETGKKVKEKVLVKPVTNSYTEVESVIIDNYSKKELFSLDKITKKEFSSVVQREDGGDLPFHEISVNISFEEEIIKETTVLPEVDSEQAIRYLIESYEEEYQSDSIKVVKYQLSKIDTFIEVD